jgi:hypothetical protein
MKEPVCFQKIKVILLIKLGKYIETLSRIVESTDEIRTKHSEYDIKLYFSNVVYIRFEDVIKL